MNADELYDLVEGFFGYKAKMRYINSATKEVACILYDSFWLKCDLDDQYGRFGAGLEIGKEGIITEFLGKRCSLNSDVESIKKSLQIIDEYCRLRLPDKFLDVYYKAYVLNQYEDCDIYKILTLIMVTLSDSQKPTTPSCLLINHSLVFLH